MDKVTSMTGYANYTAPFMIGNVLLALTLICICLLDGDIGLPKEANTMKGVKIIFTNVRIIIFLLRVGSASYVKVNAPPGTLATLNGLSGGMHFGFGKGMGGLVGGVLKDQLGSTALAFRTFGIAAFVFGVIYAIFYWAYGRGVDQRAEEKRERDAAARLAPLMPKSINGTS